MGEHQRKAQKFEKPKLFLGLPTNGGSRFNLMSILAAVQTQQSFSGVTTMEVDISLLTAAFNRLLCEALDRRDKGTADWFLLLHADIVPLEHTWLDILWQARSSVDAQAISAVAPIKDQRGVTSTALETGNLFAPRRLTIREIEQQETTFTDEKLLINTGMLLLSLRNDWIDKICFSIGDTILITKEGKRLVGCIPEDWDISRQIKKLGVPIYATQAVKLVHVGRFNYPNFGPWGLEDEDPGDHHRATVVESTLWGAP
jgi:hypothetical protein